MSAAQAQEDLLDTPAAGSYLTVSPRTMEYWRQQGTGPRFIRVGGLVRYRRSDLDEWLAGQSVGGAT